MFPLSSNRKNFKFFRSRHFSKKKFTSPFGYNHSFGYKNTCHFYLYIWFPHFGPKTRRRAGTVHFLSNKERVLKSYANLPAQVFNAKFKISAVPACSSSSLFGINIRTGNCAGTANATKLEFLVNPRTIWSVSQFTNTFRSIFACAFCNKFSEERFFHYISAEICLRLLW